MTTLQQTIKHAGLYEEVREYLVERTAFFGLVRWKEVVKVEKMNNDLLLYVKSSKPVTRLFINGVEYDFSQKETNKGEE